MKLKCFRTDISNAVINVQRAVATKATIPALEGILLQANGDELTLSGYDLEIGIITKIQATVEEEGEVVVSARLLSEIVRKSPEEIIEISTDERMTTYIKSGNANYNIVGISSMDYPELPKFETEDELTINAGLLKNMIRQTIYAVLSEIKETPIYTGSYYEMTKNQLRIVTVDGFRMAIRTETVECEEVPPFVVPAKTQSEVLKLITDEEKTVKLNIGKRHIAFIVDNYSVVSRLIEGTFINYQNIIPKETTTEFVVKTRRLLEAVERMALITNEKIKTPIRCTIANDGISLMCSTTVGRATDFIDVDYTGKETSIGFSHRFMIDALKNTDSDEVRICIKSPVEPMVIYPVKGDNFLFMVVPMRISSN